MSDGPPDDQPPEGHLQPTSPGVLTAWAVVGLIGGWLFHPLADRWSGHAPIVTWVQPVTLLGIALILGVTAWFTWREVHVHARTIEPQHAVNRLVLARACVLVGALVAGGYAGYAVSWLGSDAELAGQRVWRSVAAAAGGAAIVVAALLLERACRVRSEVDES